MNETGMNDTTLDAVRVELKYADDFYLASDDPTVSGTRTLYLLRALYHLLRAQILASHPRLADPPTVTSSSPQSNQEYERL